MSRRELVGKLIAYIVVVAVSVGSGTVVLSGNHAYNDYLNGFLGLVLILVGVVAAIGGALSLAANYYEQREVARQHEVHLTPRSGPPAAPPAWNMSGVGRPENVVRVDRMEGLAVGSRGGIRVMDLPITHLDLPIVLGALMVWTVAALLIFGPSISATAPH